MAAIDHLRTGHEVLRADPLHIRGPIRSTKGDHRLKMHGLEGLRAVDALIVQGMDSGNTAAPVFMIAENGSDLILEDARRGA